MKEIVLSQGKVAVVDDADFEWLNQWKWYFCGQYARRSIGKNKPRIFMHRVILNTPDGLETDHINNNKLDNRRDNLRICTHYENVRNSPVRCSNTSGYKGVSKSGNKWMATIEVFGKPLYLGTFNTAEEAARAYDDGAKKHFGEFANTNFTEAK